MGVHDFSKMCGDEYDRMYARFLKRPVDDLLLAAGPISGKIMVDLCAGGLRASVRAKELGAKFVLAVDISRKMMSRAKKMENAPDRCVVSDLTRCSKTNFFLGTGEFDLAICQQAVNYWWNEDAVERISKGLKDTGSFVFNTFIQRPGDAPSRYEYQIDGRRYSEEVWMVGDKIVHLQKCGADTHKSTFQWIPPQSFMLTLHEHFEEVQYDKFNNGKTLVFVARKKLTNAD